MLFLCVIPSALSDTPSIYLGDVISNVTPTIIIGDLYYLASNPKNFLNSTTAGALYYNISNPLNFINQSVGNCSVDQSCPLILYDSNATDFYSSTNPSGYASGTSNLTLNDVSTYGNATYYLLSNPLNFLNSTTAGALYYDINNPLNFVNITGNIFDQSLNTTDDVTFGEISADTINLPLDVWKVGNYEANGNFSGICYNGTATYIGSSFNLTSTGC